MSADKVQALVNYYAREGQSRHIQTVCNEVLRKRPNDPQLVFWRAYGLILEGSFSEVPAPLRLAPGPPHPCQHATPDPQHLQAGRG